MGDDNERSECHLPHTKEGREAAAYLSYILDYYDVLPKYSFFIHGGGEHWHNDVVGPWTWKTLEALRYEAVDEVGYLNLRCQHNPGCPFFLKPHEELAKGDTEDIRGRYVDTYQQLFNATVADVPDVIGAVCCAQFVVTRDTIRQRSRSDYQRMLQWLVDDDFHNSHDKGWIFETLWHHVFGKPGE